MFSCIILHDPASQQAEFPKLPTAAQIASIGGIGGAGRGGQGAGLGDDDHVAGGGVGGGSDLRGGSGASEGEDDDESADDVLHDEIPRKLYFSLSILLDRFDRLSIGLNSR